jgi:WXXGXW repeat (2 copies)
MKGLTRSIVASVILSMTLAGCVYESRPPVVYNDVAVTDAEPPATRAEVIGVAPSPGYFWVGGVWLWEGGRHVWHPGYWQAPRPGYRWVPHTWVRASGAWHLRGGRWEHR